MYGVCYETESKKRLDCDGFFPADKRCLNDTNADAGWQNGDEHE